VYYEHAFGGDVIDAQFPASGELDCAFLETTVR